MLSPIIIISLFQLLSAPFVPSIYNASIKIQYKRHHFGLWNVLRHLSTTCKSSSFISPIDLCKLNRGRRLRITCRAHYYNFLFVSCQLIVNKHHFESHSLTVCCPYSTKVSTRPGVEWSGEENHRNVPYGIKLGTVRHPQCHPAKCRGDTINVFVSSSRWLGLSPLMASVVCVSCTST